MCRCPEPKQRDGADELKTATLDVGGMLSALDYQAVEKRLRSLLGVKSRGRQQRLEQRDCRIRRDRNHHRRSHGSHHRLWLSLHLPDAVNRPLSASTIGFDPQATTSSDRCRHLRRCHGVGGLHGRVRDLCALLALALVPLMETDRRRGSAGARFARSCRKAISDASPRN